MNKILFLSLLSPALQSMERASDAAMIAALITPTAPVQQVENQPDTKKKYSCDWPGCSKSFITSSHLKRHERTHTGEKPYVCTHPSCGKSFTTSSHLTEHIRTHTGQKPYACTHPGCSEKFIQQSHLKRHMRIHTGEKPYACQYENCKKQFLTKQELTRHIRWHTGEKPYACTHPDCDKKFTTSSNLIVHMRTWHSASTEAGPAPDETTTSVLGKRTLETAQETQNDNEKQQHLLDMLYGGAITLNAGIDPFANEDQEDTNYPELQRLDYE